MNEARRNEIAGALSDMTTTQRQEYILRLSPDEQYEWICSPEYIEEPGSSRQRKEYMFTTIVILSFIFGLFLAYIL